MSVRVVTDSASDLTPGLAAANGITVVPLTIRFGAEELMDQRDLSPDEFWARCKASPELPETAAPSPGQFQAAYQRAADEGHEAILVITLSSKLSATFQSARAGAEAFGERLPIEVLDSESVTMGEGLLAIAAAEAAGAGAPLGDLVAAARRQQATTRVLGCLATLEHLQKGGRIGGAQALLGQILSIKPVVQVKDGVVAEESKQRTRSRALQYLANKVRAEGPLERLAVCTGAAPDVAELVDQLQDIEVRHPTLMVDLGPVVGTHAGPGTIGVAYQISDGSARA